MQIDIIGAANDQEFCDIRLLLRDALWEFIKARQGDYVGRRYAAHTEEFKAMKRRDVSERLVMALKIREAL